MYELCFVRISVASAKKQAAEEAKNSRTKPIPTEPVRKSTDVVSSKAKVKRKSQKMSNLAKKKKKLYCICQTPYDDSKYDSNISNKRKKVRVFIEFKHFTKFLGQNFNF